MAITTRPITDDEVLEFRQRLYRGFGEDLDLEKDADSSRMLALLPLDRTVAAFEGDSMVGTGGWYPLEVTVPGGAAVPMAGTTIITVQPTHRRRGVLTAMMRDHLDHTAASGEPLAGLWASETPIYGRFGFGHATSRDVMEAPNAALSNAASTEGMVRSVEPDTVADLFPAIYDRAAAARPGMLRRTMDWWKHQVVYDPEHWRDGSSAKRFVVYEADGRAEGYAIYTQKSKWDDFVAEGQVKVAEAISVTDRAHTGLWDYLTNIDLYPRVRYWNMPVDDPLVWKLAEPRRAERKRADALWIRIMDVPAALEARTYEIDGSIRLGVDDPFRPERSGVYELAASEGEGKTVAIDGEADVTLGIDVLGALYLGGNNAVSMAAAGLIDGSSEAVALLHRLFRTEVDPWCPEVF